MSHSHIHTLSVSLFLCIPLTHIYSHILYLSSITNRVIIAKTVKETGAVRLAQSGIDMLEHDTTATLNEFTYTFSKSHFKANLEVEVAGLFLYSPSFRPLSHVRNQHYRSIDCFWSILYDLVLFQGRRNEPNQANSTWQRRLDCTLKLKVFLLLCEVEDTDRADLNNMSKSL